jgi:hypothetical protein
MLTFARSGSGIHERSHRARRQTRARDRRSRQDRRRSVDSRRRSEGTRFSFCQTPTRTAGSEPEAARDLNIAKARALDSRPHSKWLAACSAEGRGMLARARRRSRVTTARSKHPGAENERTTTVDRRCGRGKAQRTSAFTAGEVPQGRWGRRGEDGTDRPGRVQGCRRRAREAVPGRTRRCAR